MPAQLTPKSELPVVSGKSTPNSVAMLGPGLSCNAPGRSTYFKRAPASTRLGGSDDDRGVEGRPTKPLQRFLDNRNWSTPPGKKKKPPDPSSKRPRGVRPQTSPDGRPPHPCR